MSGVNRFEVIDDTGRKLIMLNIEGVKLSYQDEGRTLKVFISQRYTQTNKTELRLGSKKGERKWWFSN